MSKDSTKTISSATKKFFSGTLLSRVTGLGREMVTASVFGCHPGIAAFWMAFRFSNLLRRMLGEGAMQASFIPHFEEMNNQSPPEANRFFRDLSFGLFLLLLMLVVVIEGVLLSILHWGGLSSGNVEILELTAIMLPAIIFICLAGLNAAYLQCHRNFVIPSIYPVAFNLFWIGSVLCLKYWGIQHGVIAWFSLSVALAYIVQWVFTVPRTLKYMLYDLPVGFFHGIKWFSRSFLKFKSNLFISIIGVSATQINSALDVIFARSADSVGPAYLNYALRLQQLPLALFGISIAGALLPPLSRAIRQGDIKEGRRFLLFAIRRCVAIMIPCTCAVVLLSTAAVNIIYGRGNFDIESTQYTAQCLTAYGLGLLPMTLVFLLASACYAYGKYRVATIASTAAMLTNVLLNSFFVFVVGMGATSVAIATSISAVVNVAILFYFVFFKVMHLKLSSLIIEQWKPFFVSFLSLLAGVIAYKWLLGYSTMQVLSFEMFEYPRILFHQILHFMVPAAVFVIVLYLSSKVLRIKEIIALFMLRF
jgi:putative peptidoglycan lipid II flippase